jgi:hypothetical protein
MLRAMLTIVGVSHSVKPLGVTNGAYQAIYYNFKSEADLRTAKALYKILKKHHKM